jgi:L-gulonolactone oxidase
MNQTNRRPRIFSKLKNMGIGKLSCIALALITMASSALIPFGPVRETLSNYQGSYECHPTAIYDPSTVEDVQSIVQRAIKQGKTLMTGNRKFASQIDAACAGEGQIQITLKNMARILSFDQSRQQITVQAGMRFNDLTDFLKEQGLAINMVTELGTFTIGGMLGSGTHGSTLTKTSNMIADYVTEMTIVDGRGQIRKLTGELLNAARVNLGVLGVVVDVTLQLEPAFKVRAKVQGYPDDSDLTQTLLSLANNHYSANVAWFPGLKRYTATTYDEVGISSTGDAYNAQANISDTAEYFFNLLFSAAHEFPGSTLQCLAARARYELRSSSYYRSLATDEIVENPVGHANQMQYFTCKKADDCIWDTLPIALQEVAIDLADLPAWIEDARAIIESNPKTCFPLNGVYFRFGPASPSYLGMNAGRDSVYIGIEYALRKEGTAEPKHYFVNQELEQMSIRKYQARPHWGKNSVAIFEDVHTKYPKWQAFLDAKKTLDPDNLFTNPFWERVRGADALNNYFTSGCNRRGECYCRIDSHCAEGLTCQTGSAFMDAKVCR